MHGAMVSLQTCFFAHRAFLELLNEVCFNNRVYHRNKLILVKSRFSKVLVTRVKKYVLPWRRKWQPTPVFLRAESFGQRSLAGCSPWGHMTKHVCMRVEGGRLVVINW